MCYDPYTETEEYKGYTIKIIQEEYPSNPREEFDNMGIMSCYHRDYILGDKKYSKRHVDLDGIVKDPKVFALGLYFHDHGMIGMSCDNDFTHDYDDGLVGYIWITKERVRKEYSCKRITRKTREKLLKYLQGEVKEYSQYLEGDVWGYQIVGPRSKYDPEECETCEDRYSCPECNGCEDGEELDSCWGYYGSDYCLQEAKSMVDYYVEQAKTKKEQLVSRLETFATRQVAC